MGTAKCRRFYSEKDKFQIHYGTMGTTLGHVIARANQWFQILYGTMGTGIWK